MQLCSAYTWHDALARMEKPGLARHLERRLAVNGLERCPGCHPEGSEGSLREARQTLRCPQGDRPSLQMSIYKESGEGRACHSCSKMAYSKVSHQRSFIHSFSCRRPSCRIPILVSTCADAIFSAMHHAQMRCIPNSWKPKVRSAVAASVA